MTRAALEAGLHVVAEKPWFGTPEETAELIQAAHAAQRIVAVHYEYCLVDAFAEWREQFRNDSSLTFAGRFHHSRQSHAGISALDNLGTHLLSIREWAAPRSRLGLIDCAYGMPDQRLVWLEREGVRVAAIDLLATKEPIIQRFIGKLEAGLEGAAFPFDLEFALRVADSVAAVRGRSAEAAR